MGGFGLGLASGMLSRYGELSMLDEQREFQQKLENKKFALDFLTKYVNDPATKPEGIAAAMPILGKISNVTVSGRRGKGGNVDFNDIAPLYQLDPNAAARAHSGIASGGQPQAAGPAAQPEFIPEVPQPSSFAAPPPPVVNYAPPSAVGGDAMGRLPTNIGFGGGPVTPIPEAPGTQAGAAGPVIPPPASGAPPSSVMSDLQGLMGSPPTSALTYRYTPQELAGIEARQSMAKAAGGIYAQELETRARLEEMHREFGNTVDPVIRASILSRLALRYPPAGATRAEAVVDPQGQTRWVDPSMLTSLPPGWSPYEKQGAGIIEMQNTKTGETKEVTHEQALTLGPDWRQTAHIPRPTNYDTALEGEVAGYMARTGERDRDRARGAVLARRELANDETATLRGASIRNVNSEIAERNRRASGETASDLRAQANQITQHEEKARAEANKAFGDSQTPQYLAASAEAKRTGEPLEKVIKRHKDLYEEELASSKAGGLSKDVRDLIKVRAITTGTHLGSDDMFPGAVLRGSPPKAGWTPPGVNR